MADERNGLRAALDPSYRADEACIAALDAGAALRTSNDTAAPGHLLTIYTRRVEHLRQTGARTVGSDDFIDRLRRADGPLRLASVDDAEWHFAVFLNASDGRVITTWGVEARERNAATGE